MFQPNITYEKACQQVFKPQIRTQLLKTFQMIIHEDVCVKERERDRERTRLHRSDEDHGQQLQR